ncbi:MAG: hypothetical protein ACOZNI_36890 [Myxococcota bacterium]
MADPLKSVLDRTADAPTVTWAHEGKGDVSRLPDPLLAIAAAAALGNTKALQSVQGPKELRKAAAAALHKLRSQGVKVEAPVAPKSVGLGKEVVDVPSRAFLSLPDNQGDIELLLSSTDREGTCLLGVVLGASGTVREAQHAHLSRGELRDVWKQAEGRADIREVPFTTGLHFADLWLQKHHAFTHFCEHVPPATLASARLLDPMTRAPAPAADEDPEKIQPWVAPLGMLDEASLHEGVHRAIDQMNSEIATDDDQRKALVDAAIDEAADAVLHARNRAPLARAAELAAVAYRFHGYAKVAAELRDTARKLEAGDPGRTMPPVVLAVRLSIMSHLLGEAHPE